MAMIALGPEESTPRKATLKHALGDEMIWQRVLYEHDQRLSRPQSLIDMEDPQKLQKQEKYQSLLDTAKAMSAPLMPQTELEQNARRAALEAVQQAALQMGILSNAQHNAETTVREFLHTVGVSNVTFRARAT